MEYKLMFLAFFSLYCAYYFLSSRYKELMSAPLKLSRHIALPPQVYSFSQNNQPLYYPDQNETPRNPFEMELTVCKVPISLRRDIYGVFPEVERFSKENTGTQIYVIVTYQRSEVDLVGWTDSAAAEKDKLLENYMAFASRFTQVLQEYAVSKGEKIFSDYTDPCSGLPVLTRASSSVFAEVDAIQALLKYPLDQVGSCTIVKHPRWGSSSYPASMITTANPELIAKAFEYVSKVGTNTHLSQSISIESPNTISSMVISSPNISNSPPTISL